MSLDQISAGDALAKIMTLSPVERAKAAQELWDSVSGNPAVVPVPAWHLKEVARRKTEADANPDSLLSEEEFWRQVDAE